MHFFFFFKGEQRPALAEIDSSLSENWWRRDSPRFPPGRVRELPERLRGVFETGVIAVGQIEESTSTTGPPP